MTNLKVDGSTQLQSLFWGSKGGCDQTLNNGPVNIYIYKTMYKYIYVVEKLFVSLPLSTFIKKHIIIDYK